MAQIILQALEPGTEYVVQVRAKDQQGRTSEWSTAYTVLTSSDITPPNPPTNFTFQNIGTAFKANWKSPLTDSNGKPLKDLKDFRVKLTAGADERVWFTASETFNLGIEENIAAFTTPRPSITCEVRARDIAGNLSSAVTATATNARPSNVTNLLVQGIIGGVSVDWKAVTDDDLKQYEVYISTSGAGFTPDSTNLRYSGTGTGYVYTTTNATPHYVKVRAVDVFLQTSQVDATGSATPSLSTDVDTTPPNAPTGVTVATAASTDGQSAITVSWTGVSDTDIDGYRIRYSKDGTVYSYVDVPRDISSATLLDLAPSATYYVAVAARDFSGNASGWVNANPYPITSAKDTQGPSQPSTPTVSVNTQSAQVQIGPTKNVGGPIETDMDFWEVHASTTSNFTPGLSTLRGTVPYVGPGVTVQAVFAYTATDSMTQLYWKTVAVDKSGNKSASASPQAVGLPGLIQGINVVDATLTNAKIANLDASKLNAGTAFVNDLFVRANFTLDAASGHIKSSNYNATNLTGWTLDNTGLVIYDGQIAAKSLLLQESSQNLIPLAFSDFEFASDYYHDASNTLNAVQLSSSTVNVKGQIVTTGIKFSKQSFRIFDNVVASGGTSRIYFAPSAASATGVNIDVVAGDHIVSVWAKRTTTKGATIRLGMYTDQATTLLPATAAVSVPATTWVRYSWVITVPAAVTKVKLFMDIVASGQATYDITIDGLQIERKIGASTTPSQFTPPSSTFIEGGSITTGTIKSSASAAGVVGQPAWSLNAQGNAQMGDALVRGTLTVGAGTDLESSVVTSAGYDLGQSGWIIRGDGSAEFNNLSTRGNASGPSAGYDSISASQSLLYKGQELSTYLTTAATGEVAYAYMFADVRVFDTTKRGLLEISWNAKAGRAYKIHWTAFRAKASAQGVNGFQLAWFTQDGSQPTTASAEVWLGEMCFPFAEQYIGVNPTPWIYHAPTNHTVRAMVGCAVLEAGFTMTLAFDGVQVWVEDLGAYQPNNGVDRWSGSAPVKQRYSFDYQPYDSRSYKGNGQPHNPSTGAAEIMYQGDFGTDGNTRSWMWFDPQFGLNALIGVPLADIEYCELYLNYDHWYYSSGGVAFIGYHTQPGISNVEQAGGFPGLIQVGWEGRDIGKWINVRNTPAIMDAIRAGTFKGFMLGNTGNATRNHYGYAHGAGRAIGQKPGFRCAYYK